MGTGFRKLAAWAVSWSLIAGVWLPLLGGSDAADIDGICGQVFVLPASVEHFEADRPTPSRTHCLFCHWRNTMASAFTAGLFQVVQPLGALGQVTAGSARGVDLAAIRQTPPRGPPALA